MNGGQYYQKLWLEMGPRCESKPLKWDLVVRLIQLDDHYCDDQIFSICLISELIFS